jgi:hypothetical protein
MRGFFVAFKKLSPCKGGVPSAYALGEGVNKPPLSPDYLWYRDSFPSFAGGEPKKIIPTIK